MRWLTFAILAYLIIAIQMALGGFLKWGRAEPNLILPFVIFIAINARREPSLVAALLLGALQDLFTDRPMGLYAFSYGMMALFIVGAQPAVYRDHPISHFVLTLAGALFTGVVVCFNEWAFPRIHALDPVRPSVLAILGAALYTSALAPLLLWPLVRIKSLFGFRAARARLPMFSREPSPSTKE